MLCFSRGGRRGLSDTLGVLSDVRPLSRGRGFAAVDRGRGLGRVPLCPVVLEAMLPSEESCVLSRVLRTTFRPLLFKQQEHLLTR